MPYCGQQQGASRAEHGQDDKRPSQQPHLPRKLETRAEVNAEHRRGNHHQAATEGEAPGRSTKASKPSANNARASTQPPLAVRRMNFRQCRTTNPNVMAYITVWIASKRGLSSTRHTLNGESPARKPVRPLLR